MAGKKFSLFEVILSVICVVFTIEAAAPASAMGNVQFFWWIFLIITFLLPYGLVVAELGTAFDSEGGLYDWVRLGLGDRWGARCSWCYWVNFPLWVASIACMFPSVINAVWGIEFSLGVRIAIELAFVWGVTVMAMQPVAEADWVMDGGAVIKVLITAVVGIVGIWFACNNGFANDMSFETFIPDLGDTNSLTFLSIILFNFMGFEVVATFASTMKSPSRDIPKAVIAGGVAIAAIYIICGIGIGAAVPTEQLSLDSGIVDAVAAMVGRTHPLTMIVGVAFLVTLFANMICWSFGVNNVASYAARHGNMPRPFALVSKKTGMPDGSALINGCFASLVLLLQIPLGEGPDVFWVFFSMNVVFLLMSYIPMFPAFWRLRKYDGRPRVFCAPFVFWQSIVAGAGFCLLWGFLVYCLWARACSFAAVLGERTVTVYSGVALPVRQVLPRRAVTSVRLLRTPLLRLGGVSLLIVAAPGAKLFLPAIPAQQAGLLAHILAEDAP